VLVLVLCVIGNVKAGLPYFVVDAQPLYVIGDVDKTQKGRSAMPRTVTVDVGGKRYPINMRTTKQLREKLEMAVSKSGRSLAQEIEYRLEQSFEQSSRIEMLERALEKEQARSDKAMDFIVNTIQPALHQVLKHTEPLPPENGR
jgi:hypothetical protein